ncbi:MAG: PfkB family carbohydrate kinase [Paludibacteraceae bacterium]|nr:PfkB family carbohydrate kinase [Paludibacteraceae bacterium]
MQKTVLLIGDLVGYGRLAITAQASVLTRKGFSVAYLPTALVSNNFCYQNYALFDTTEYMRQSINVWKELGFRFDMISVGFVASDEQAELLSSFCLKQKQLGSIIVVDPIMADNGHLYSGIGQETIDRLRKMVAIADVAIPNYTEACYLTDTPFSASGLDGESSKKLLDSMRTIGTSSVLITSSRVNNQTCVLGYDVTTDEYLTLPYREVPVDFSGTGDIFSGKLISMLMQGRSLQAAAQITIEKLSAMIDIYQDVENKNEGLPY